MFGKNYDNEIKELKNTLEAIAKLQNSIVKQQNEHMDLFSSLQKDMIEMARNQAQHKESITFLLNHATVDEDAKTDFFKMLKKIKELREVK